MLLLLSYGILCEIRIRHLVSSESELINITAGDEMVKGGFKGRLGIVKKGLPAIPSCCSQSARGVGETIEIQGEVLILAVCGAGEIHGICAGII